MSNVRVKSLLFDNFSYKIVALLIALILWITILGRRDFAVTRNIEIELLVGSGQSVVAQSAEAVKVRATGPRTALRRFIDSGASQVISIDLSGKSEGSYDVEIPAGKLDVPFGVKIQSMKPSHLQVTIGKKE
jgi:YbbR domain-containing protein